MSASPSHSRAPDAPRLADGFDDDPRCTACGGHAVFDPRAGHLRCLSCGVARDLAYHDRDAAGRALRDMDIGVDPDLGPAPDWPDAPDDGAVATGDIRACSGCGGQVVFVGHALSTECPWCGRPSTALEAETAYATAALVPFAIDRATAMARAADWLASRPLLPRGVAERAGTGRLIGLYAPFWVFETRETVRYVATASVAQQRGAATPRETLLDTIEMTLEEFLVPASPHVPPEMRDALSAGFRPGQLRALRPGYLAGFAAERHHQSLRDGLAASTAERDLLIRAALRDRVVPPHLVNLSHRAELRAARYRRVLLPVWILHYRHGGSRYRVMVSGIDGQTRGERPLAHGPILGASGLLTALAMAAGWAAARMV